MWVSGLDSQCEGKPRQTLQLGDQSQNLTRFVYGGIVVYACMHPSAVPETSSKLFWKSDLNVDTWKFLCQTALTTKQLPVIRQMWGDHGRSYLGRSRNSRVSVSSRLAAKQEVPQSSIQSPVVLHMLMCFSLLFIAFHCLLMFFVFHQMPWLIPIMYRLNARRPAIPRSSVDLPRPQSIDNLTAEKNRIIDRNRKR